MVQNGELCRITQSRYEEIKAIVSSMEENLEKDKRPEAVRFMVERDKFPTIDMLRGMEVESRVRDFLPWLIYYRDAYVPDEEEREKFEKTKEYIRKILSEWLDIIPDEALAHVKDIRPKRWGEMTLENRCDALRDLVGYYSPDEFEGFMLDIGWQKFMRVYGIEDKSAYNDCDQLREDLKAVWDSLQSELPSLI